MRKESTSSSRLEEELDHDERPIYVIVISVVLKLLLCIYDVVTYLPFKLIIDPEKQVEHSEQIKAVKIGSDSETAVWRHVDTAGKDLWQGSFEGCDTLGKLWDNAARTYTSMPCMGTREVLKVHLEKQPNGRTFQKLELGEYIWKNYRDIDDAIKRVACAMNSLGQKKSEKVVIYAETRMEWMVSALACLKCGFPVATMYPTLGDAAIQNALTECDATIMFTTKDLLSKLATAVQNAPKLKTVIYFPPLHKDPNESIQADDTTKEQFSKMQRTLHSFDAILEMGSAKTVPKNEVKPGDLAMIMYTSGTTANPKGVMLSHGNIISALASQFKVVIINTEDIVIGYLPLAHIIEVCVELGSLAKGTRIGYSSPQTLTDKGERIFPGTKGDCALMKPTLIACVPAVLDKVYKAVIDSLKSKSFVQREVFKIFYKRNLARYEDGYGKSGINFVFKEIRNILGGNVRLILSGGAALNEETQRFITICFGCPVIQGYGLTETCGGASIAEEFDLTTGSVGPPLRCCEIMLREWTEGGYSPNGEVPQGELMIHGANVALGYYKNEEKTREAFIEINGKQWFATGDIGQIEPNGNIKIIDRKKDLVKLSHGEYVSFGHVETVLRMHDLVDNICVYGNYEHSYLVALVVPNKKNLEELAKKIGIDKPFAEMCLESKMRQAVSEELRTFSRDKLMRREIPQRVFLCSSPWESDTPAGPGLLTETKKLKRKKIVDEFATQIKELYEEEN